MEEITIDYSRLQDTISRIDSESKKLQELFNKQNSNFKLLEDNKMWCGTSNQNCIAKYNELSSKYDEIISNLNNYKQFLFNLGETYKNIYLEAEKKTASNGQ